MAEIWETRYTNEKGKKESAKVFEMFQLFLQQNKPRSLKQFTTDLYFNGQKSEELYTSKEFQRKYKSIQKNSANYKWFDRANAYDNYWRKYNNKLKSEIIADLELSAIQKIINGMERIDKNHQDFCDEETEMVVVGDSLLERKVRKTAKIHSDNEYANSMKTSLETIYLIKNGGTLKTSNKNTDTVKLSADVKQKLDAKTIFDIVDEELDLK